MGELVHPQNYTGVLNLTVVFLIASSAILMNMAGVSHLVSLMPVGEGKDERLRSIQGDSWIPLAHWRCLTPFPLVILITSASSYHGSALIILLNWPLWLFRKVHVPLVWAVSVGVKPVRMIHGGVGTPPELHRGVEPNCCLSYSLFSHTNEYGWSLPPSIVDASRGG